MLSTSDGNRGLLACFGIFIDDDDDDEKTATRVMTAKKLYLPYTYVLVINSDLQTI